MDWGRSLMPLPDGGAWPPPDLAPVFQRLAAWSAWYSGNPDELAAVYGAQGGGVPFDQVSLDRVANHPAQYRGGVVGLLARWFWGEPINLNQKRAKLHVPVAADIARTSAELLFSEPPTITVPADDAEGATKTQDRIEQLVDDGVHATLLEAAEICAALGGVYLAVCWDRDVMDRPWLAARHPDAAVPEWRYGKLAAVTFWRVLEDDGKRVVRHLERHERGAIMHAVYEGTPENLGKRVDLAAFPETENLDDVVQTQLDRLTATYVPNMRPNRVWRNLPAAAYCGRSDFTGIEPFMDALDETWSSWMRDIRQGKGRILVPEQYLENLGPGRGSRWDPEREVYEQLSMLPSQDRDQITHIQFAIRVAEHRDTAREQVETVIRGGGYSLQTFGLADDVAVTATEVRAREKSSITTRGRKIVYWRPGVAEAVETLLMVDAELFASGITPVRPAIDFGDYVGADRNESAQTAQMMRAAEAASTQTLVEMLHPDWDDDQVAEEVARIQEERDAQMPQPVDLGGPGDDPGGPEEPEGEDADEGEGEDLDVPEEDE